MGRPKIYPAGTTAAQRVKASTAALVQAGGSRETFRLGAEAKQALDALMAAPGAPATKTALIERLLVEAARRI